MQGKKKPKKPVVLSIEQQLIECTDELKPIILKALKKKRLSAKNRLLLYSCIENAWRGLEASKDSLNPKSSKPELRQYLEDTANKVSQLQKDLHQILTDQRTIDLLPIAHDTLKKFWLPQQMGISEHGVIAMMDLSRQIAYLERLLLEIKRSIPSKRGADTNIRQVPMLSLVHGWMKITGSYPGVSSAKDTNNKVGNFVDFCRSFFARFDPKHHLSGDTIDKYLKELEPIFIVPDLNECGPLDIEET